MSNWVICSVCRENLETDNEDSLRGGPIVARPCKYCASKIQTVLIKYPLPIRNLLYHITPLANWRWNVDQLLKRIDVFTGRKIIAIAMDEKFDPIEDVITLFKGIKDFTFVLVDNHPELRETHSLAALLLKASNFDKSGVTFYAHTKGVTRKEDPAVTLWTDAMYHYNLDDPNRVDEHLKKFPITGCCKRYGRFANFPRQSTYHYSGTFFWFRNQDLFDRNWTQVPQVRYGAEAYLSLLFKDAEAGCLWGDKFHNGYDWNYLKETVKNDSYFEKFLAEHRAHNPNWSSTRSLRNVQTVDRKAVPTPKRMGNRR